MNPQIFVFGSNLAGRHGAGAAKYAREVFGAEYGVGEGRTGRAYALPTKDEKLRTRPAGEIANSFAKLADAARAEPKAVFVLTPVGCGLAGIPVAVMARIVKEANLPSNVVLHRSWLDHIQERTDTP